LADEERMRPEGSFRIAGVSAPSFLGCFNDAGKASVRVNDTCQGRYDESETFGNPTITPQPFHREHASPISTIKTNQQPSPRRP